MRQVTRNVAIGLVVVIILLLALGVLPGLLRSGPPYYVTATAATADGATVNGSQIPSSRFPYTTTALADASPDTPGRSGAYYEGPLGIKEMFTHSPFDELSALRQRNPNATVGTSVRIADNNTVYRVSINRSGRE